MKITFAARSETGRVRKNNEDNLYCNGVIMEREDFFLRGISGTPAVFAVCDGMGGEDCGEVASRVGVETLAEHADEILCGGYEAVNDYVRDTNEKLRAYMKAHDVRTGATLALVVVNEGKFTAYNLGDSRIYTTEGHTLLKVTADHTLAEEKIMLGELTPAKALHSRYRNILTRYLGMFDDFNSPPDVYAPKDFGRILLCSDGLTDMMTHREISGIMSSYDDVSDVVNALVDGALNNGGIDNVTCIVIDGGQ